MVDGHDDDDDGDDDDDDVDVIDMWLLMMVMMIMMIRRIPKRCIPACSKPMLFRAFQREDLSQQSRIHHLA